MWVLFFKPVSPFGVKLKHQALLLRGHLASFEARVQVIDPPQPATLAGSVQTYKHKNGTSTTQKCIYLVKWLAPRKSFPSPNNHTYYLSPATFKPETLAMKSQRRSPNKPTKHTSWKSSCSVHGPFLISC